MNHQSTYRLAIDFGTSNTTAAIAWDSGRPEALQLSTNGNAMPSAVTLYEGRFVVGQPAVNLGKLDPSAHEPTPKRRLGESRMMIGGMLIPPPQLVAAVLDAVVRIAVQRANGRYPEQVVLTHPEQWGEHRVGELWLAAQIAGLDTTRLVLASEPVCAAWHYAARGRFSPGQRIAVVDFGGGTFDVAVLDFVPNSKGHARATVVGRAGIDPLGGVDFDRRLCDWTVEQLSRDGRTRMVAELRNADTVGSQLTLRDAVRDAKEALSSHPKVPIAVSAAGEQATYTVTRDEFERLISNDVEHACREVSGLLTHAGTSVAGGPGSELAQLFLTGGSSLIPAVQNRFQELTGGRVGTLGDPKQITCLGALENPELVPQQTEPATPVVPLRRSMWSRPVGVLVATLVAVGLVIGVAMFQRNSANGTGEPTAQASPASSPSVTPDPSTTPAASPSSTAVGCVELSASDCQVLNASGAQRWVVSCKPDDDDGWFDCLPRDDTGAPPTMRVFVATYGNLPGLKKAADKWFADQGGANPGKDARNPPAKDTWHDAEAPDKRLGLLYSIVYKGEARESPTLIWSLDSTKTLMMARATEGTLGAIYNWWEGK